MTKQVTGAVGEEGCNGGAVKTCKCDHQTFNQSRRKLFFFLPKYLKCSLVSLGLGN